ncbi:WecB/TagA/CpsF family glycosyltransferase [Candidatus Saccharibacteria bacterium]|nr:WecB/TagA/CpsF family glycosyltransferase [Candidatus Saccharibacteria bacterium]
MKTETILGVKVSITTIKEICEYAIKAINGNEKMVITSINPEIIIKGLENRKTKEILNSATHNLPDGIGVVLASRLLKGCIKERIAGIDCAEALCEAARNQKFKVFLYGAKKGVAKKAKEKLEEKYPGLRIVGTIDGYEKDKDKIVRIINESQANIVLVALGGGKQERWIHDNYKKVNAQVFQSVGGSFDVFSGDSKRAPKLMQKFGVEWLFRLIKEPSRFKRQAKIPKFVFLVLKERFKRKN